MPPDLPTFLDVTLNQIFQFVKDGSDPFPRQVSVLCDLGKNRTLGLPGFNRSFFQQAFSNP